MHNLFLIHVYVTEHILHILHIFSQNWYFEMHPHKVQISIPQQLVKIQTRY